MNTGVWWRAGSPGGQAAKLLERKVAAMPGVTSTRASDFNAPR
jgi:hypothetical protein